MGIIGMVVLAALLSAGATNADRASPQKGGRPEAGHITREWTWSDGGTVTTFTATGPADQVNALDPRNGPLACQGCALASSVSFADESP